MASKAKAIILKEQKALTKLLSMFEEQLKRLKVEEMALMSQIKMESLQESNTSADQEVKTYPVAMFQEASELNQETLDLQVTEPGAARNMSEFNYEELKYEDDEIEEEEEENESDDEDKDECDMSNSYTYMQL